jgi:predicted nucleic acid-binding protein
MFVLDTDTLSLFLRGNARVTERVAQAREEVAITLIAWIEILQGRFATVLKAENGERLLHATQRLAETQRDLNRFTIFNIEMKAATQFDRLRQSRKLKR